MINITIDIMCQRVVSDRETTPESNHNRWAQRVKVRF